MILGKAWGIRKWQTVAPGCSPRLEGPLVVVVDRGVETRTCGHHQAFVFFPRELRATAGCQQRKDML